MLTQEQTQQKINERHNTDAIVIVGGYKNTRSKCWFNDSRCDHSKWEASPFNIKRGRGCPKCRYIKSSKTQTLSQEQIQQKINEKHNTESIVIVSEYKNITTTCLFNDKRCDHPEWTASPNVVIHSGSGCPICGIEKSTKSKTSSQKQVQQKINEKHNTESIVIVSEYKNTRIKCWFNDKRCDHSIWMAAPASIVSGRGCPACGKIKRVKSKTLSQEQTQQKINNKHGKNNIVIVSGYKKTKTKCWFNDKRCAHQKWSAVSDKIMRGQGCPECGNNNSTANKIITKIKNLRLHKYFKKECSPDFIGLKKYDLAMVLKNGIAIVFEYDGEFHDEPHWSVKTKEEKRKSLNSVRRRDREKNNQSADNGIYMIRLNHKDYKADEVESVQYVLDEIRALSEGVEEWEEWLED